MSDDSAIPRHVGIIMDGNRRWAKQHGLPALKGHAKGQEILRQITHHAFEAGVKYLTVYAFSTENWRRAEEEVGYLMRQVAKALKTYTQEFVDGGVKIIFLGVRDDLPSSVRQAIEQAEAATATSTKSTLSICFNYGGQQEIVDATKTIVAEGIPAKDITPELIAAYLYAPDVPPVDLIIRTSGEQRLSNFMLWRASYSELIFTNTLWPDFTITEFDTMLTTYAQRQRRFGN